MYCRLRPLSMRACESLVNLHTDAEMMRGGREEGRKLEWNEKKWVYNRRMCIVLESRSFGLFSTIKLGKWICLCRGLRFLSMGCPATAPLLIL